jgi:hypothetical protein
LLLILVDRKVRKVFEFQCLNQVLADLLQVSLMRRHCLSRLDTGALVLNRALRWLILRLLNHNIYDLGHKLSWQRDVPFAYVQHLVCVLQQVDDKLLRQFRVQYLGHNNLLEHLH